MLYKEDYFGFVYIWYDTKHKKFIIGSHHGSISDGYTTGTGGLHVRRIFKSRPETMKRRILAYNPVDDFRETRAIEQKYLNLRPNIESNHKYYNINNNALGGIGGWDHVNNDPNRINPMSNKDVRDRHQQVMSQKVLEDKHYFCKHMSDGWNPMKIEEIKNNHPSLFTKENNPMNSEAMRKRASIIHTEISGKPVSVCGSTYDSLRGAARELGISPQKLRYRLNSPSFEDHFFIQGDVDGL